jgi:hypothetical protein
MLSRLIGDEWRYLDDERDWGRHVMRSRDALLLTSIAGSMEALTMVGRGRMRCGLGSGGTKSARRGSRQDENRRDK